jgi:hypothetical protein
MARQCQLPRFELALGRQLATDEQVRGFLEARALGQILDRIAPVFEDSQLAVDEADAGLGGWNFSQAGHIAPFELGHSRAPFLLPRSEDSGLAAVRQTVF